MQLQYTYTRLNVENFQSCKAFYRDVLGLSIQLEDDMGEYVEFDTGATRITLFNRRKLGDFVAASEALGFESHSGRVVLSFLVPNLDEAVSYLQGHAVELLNPPTNYADLGFISTCFRDPDGNMIELAQMR